MRKSALLFFARRIHIDIFYGGQFGISIKFTNAYLLWQKQFHSTNVLYRFILSRVGNWGLGNSGERETSFSPYLLLNMLNFVYCHLLLFHKTQFLSCMSVNSYKSRHIYLLFPSVKVKIEREIQQVTDFSILRGRSKEHPIEGSGPHWRKIQEKEVITEELIRWQ